MAISITREGKNSLVLETPVMAAAGILGFADEYRSLLKIEKLGALVTNPVTLAPWSPASGTRVVPLASGILIHTGLPNKGLHTVISDYRTRWEKLALSIILHFVANSPDEARQAVERVSAEDTLSAIELGLSDDLPLADCIRLVRAAADRAEKPVLVRVPFGSSVDYARAIADAGADGLVVCAPPRGTARDSTGQLVPGRLYGPWVKPMALRLVGQIARAVNVPVTGAGGIHSPDDARDYLEAGAVAVQVDAVVWVAPKQFELIARELGGLVITQPSGALPDEWHPGMGETERRQRTGQQTTKEDKKK